MLQLPSRYVDNGALFGAESPNSADCSGSASPLALNLHQLEYLRQFASRFDTSGQSPDQGSSHSYDTSAVGSPEDLDEMEVANNLDDFMQTGRTGRRNAVPDIENDKDKTLGTGDLQLQMDKLSCADPQPSTSGYTNPNMNPQTNQTE